MMANTAATTWLIDRRLRHLNGRIPDNQGRLVEHWYAGACAVLVETWNRTRPADCPGGPIAI